MAYKPSITHHAQSVTSEAHQAPAAEQPGSNKARDGRLVQVAFVALLIAIVLIAIIVRLGLAKYAGLFEPDGFFYYADVRATIANLSVVDHPPLSGYPEAHFLNESSSLIYLTVVLYFLFNYFGIGYYAIMRFIPVVFGVLEVIVAYYIGKEIINKRAVGLLAAFFVAVSSGNVARTAALVYRGDSFITLFLMVALLFGMRALKGKPGRLTYVYAVLGAFVLSVGLAIWTGSSFALITYIMALYLLVVYGFVKADKEFLFKICLLSGALLLTYILWHAYAYFDLARATMLLYDAHFFLLYLPLIALCVAAYYMIAHNTPNRLVATAGSRIGTLLVVGFIAILVIGSVFNSYLTELLSVTGGSSSSNPIGSTTQELLAPTFSFLFASFSYQLYYVWIGIALPFVLAFYYNRRQDAPRAVHLNGSAFIAVLTYFMVTFYLQLRAIRWNSLVSIPIAILSAVGLYIIWALIEPKGYGRFRLAFVLYAILAVLFVLEINVAYVQSYSSAQADGINPLFLSAMSWMSSNTPQNATVVALWPDGSVVEGWGNRRSYMDSVSGEIEPHIYRFSEFLFNTTTDSNYLYSIGKPDYLVARNYWFNELAGIAVEGSIPNATLFGYDVLDQAHINSTATQKRYLFSSSASPYYAAEFVLNISANGTTTSHAAIGVANSQYQQIQHVILYNAANYSYMVIDYSTAPQNYTLFVAYSGNAVTGATILGPKLPYSNLFKLIFLCNFNSCAYGDSNVVLRAVYINNDTRIYKISYLR